MPTTKVVVNLTGKPSYDVRIGSGVLESLGNHLRTFNQAQSAFIITDSTVAELYLAAAKESLSSAGYEVHSLAIRQGETSKTIDAAIQSWDALSDLSLSRDCLVVALGGGVVGDIAGFVASTYLRGVDYVQVPTTLLAMVDSSVGGKTGINLAQGKNLVGTFKQPLYVGASTDVLATLPEREWACGCGEIAKSATIDSDDFFFWLSKNAQALQTREEDIVAEAITRSVVFKAAVVARDEQETQGIRECLNYGHTFGHALETLLGYGVVSHGHAVAEGMRFAARLGMAVLGTSPEFVKAQDEMLDFLGLSELRADISPDEALFVMMHDKKVRQSVLRFVLPRDVGEWELVSLEADTILEYVEAWTTSKI